MGGFSWGTEQWVINSVQCGIGNILENLEILWIFALLSHQFFTQELMKNGANGNFDGGNCQGSEQTKFEI